MAAAAAGLEQLPLGSRVVAPTDCYTAVGGLLTQGQEIGRWSAERVDASDTGRSGTLCHRHDRPHPGVSRQRALRLAAELVTFRILHHDQVAMADLL